MSAILQSVSCHRSPHGADSPDRKKSTGVDPLALLGAEVTCCRRCARLVAWREEVAQVKRAAYRDQHYWGRPVPGFGDPAARIVVLGLAPAAHGGNRTGRIFTGDRSGDWLFAALWRAGLASQPQSVSRDDGLTLSDCWVTAAVRCAPPANRPSPEERDHCLPWLSTELGLLPRARVIVCLGAFAWDAALRTLAAPRPWPKFSHGAEVPVLNDPSTALSAAPDPPTALSAAPDPPTAPGPLTLLGSYHVSQQNTFTGRLTEPMLDAVFARAVELTT